MARRKVTTRAEIIKVATEMYLENGYSNTTTKAICDRIGISTGNLTFYFPTKEHLLDILVEMVCDFQWDLMKKTVAEGNTSLMAYCLEFITMIAACDQDEIIKDFFVSAYRHPMTLETIRRNDVEKARLVFESFHDDWTDLHYVEAETLVSGIEYGTLMTTGDSAGIEARINGALRTILGVYLVPKDLAMAKIQKATSLNYREIGTSTLKKFREFVFNIDDQYVEDMYLRYCEKSRNFKK